jgi:hypothetical protein
MTKLYRPENDRCWPVRRAGAAGLTPVSTYRGSDDKAAPWERGHDSNDAKGGQSNEARDPFAGGRGNLSDPNRIERDHKAERRGMEQTVEELSRETENHPLKPRPG